MGLSGTDSDTVVSHSQGEPACVSRRGLLAAGGAALVGAVSWSTWRRATMPRAAVFVARHQRYDGSLQQTVQDGLRACGLSPTLIHQKRVLLKPNLVEPARGRPQMTTHPAIIVAVAEAFRAWGARVAVGEAPGHVRDTEMALIESGVAEALSDSRLEFKDLNYEAARWVANRGGQSPLAGFYFPQSVLQADLVVSLPKLKTHHWVGMTASMKNMYGVLPGSQYGWPKNVLHHAGIPQTVVDINASLPSLLTVVDAIECMEGDGPILGTAKPLGLVLVGANLPAVDATAARIMGLAPRKIAYLQLAERRLGPLGEAFIEQRGESWRSVANPFQLLDRPHLQRLRA